jgi:hypothetical protein
LARKISFLEKYATRHTPTATTRFSATFAVLDRAYLSGWEMIEAPRRFVPLNYRTQPRREYIKAPKMVSGKRQAKITWVTGKRKAQRIAFNQLFKYKRIVLERS